VTVCGGLKQQSPDLAVFSGTLVEAIILVDAREFALSIGVTRTYVRLPQAFDSTPVVCID
jgi:hypothetical protein